MTYLPIYAMEQLPYQYGDDRLQIAEVLDTWCATHPEHLELGTQADNIQDMISRGRGAWQR